MLKSAVRELCLPVLGTVKFWKQVNCEILNMCVQTAQNMHPCTSRVKNHADAHARILPLPLV